MEALIAAGSLCAYLYSVYRLFQGSAHVYFDTASMLITLTLLREMLDSRAKDRVQSQLGNFFALMPRKVKICTEKYPEGQYVPIDHLKQNDTFMVEQGETVAAGALLTSLHLPAKQHPLRKIPEIVSKLGPPSFMAGFVLRPRA